MMHRRAAALLIVNTWLKTMLMRRGGFFGTVCYKKGTGGTCLWASRRVTHALAASNALAMLWDRCCAYLSAPV